MNGWDAWTYVQGSSGAVWHLTTGHTLWDEVNVRCGRSLARLMPADRVTEPSWASAELCRSCLHQARRDELALAHR